MLCKPSIGHTLGPALLLSPSLLTILLAVCTQFIYIATAQGRPTEQPLQHGRALLDAWQLEDAITIAAHELMQQPTDTHARAFAAEVMHQRGQHVEALQLLGATDDDANNLLRAPMDPKLAKRLAQFVPQLVGSAQYAGAFATLHTPHFRISYQNKDEIMAHFAQDVLESAYRHIGAALGAHPAEEDEKIAVEIYPTIEGLAKATGLTEQEIETSGTIAVCKFHRVMVVSALATATGYAWADTLAHELTHLMVSKRSHNSVPIWLHEGIAKYFETAWRGAPGMALTPYSETVLAKASKNNALIPFARMHPSMAKLPNQRDATLAFAEVFMMVKMVVQERGPKAIADILAALGEGVPFDTALRSCFGGNIRTLERQLQGYVRHQKLRHGFAQAAPLRVDATGAGTQGAHQPNGALNNDVDDQEAKRLLRLGELLILRNHEAEAIDPLQRAYARVGIQLPHLGVRLAKSMLAAQDRGGAERILAQTLKVHEDLIAAHKLYAEISVQKKAWHQAIASCRSYVLHNPFDASVHALWAEALEALGDADEAARQKRFAMLASKPRTLSDVNPKFVGTAALRLITEPWGTACIDGSSLCLPTPAWHVPISPGHHTLRVTARFKRKILVAEGAVEAVAGAATLWRQTLDVQGVH